MIWKCIRALVVFAVVGATLVPGLSDVQVSAAPPDRCVAWSVTSWTGLPDYEKRWCDSQHQAMINECTNRFHEDSYRMQKCYAEANQWYADCLAGKHLHYRLSVDVLPPDRLRQ